MTCDKCHGRGWIRVGSYSAEGIYSLEGCPCKKPTSDYEDADRQRLKHIKEEMALTVTQT